MRLLLVSERFNGKVLKSYSPCFIPKGKDKNGKMQFIRAKKITGQHVIKEVWQDEKTGHIILKCWDNWKENMNTDQWHTFWKKNG